MRVSHCDTCVNSRTYAPRTHARTHGSTHNSTGPALLRCNTCLFSLRKQGVWMLYDAPVYIYDTSTVKEDADGDVSCTKVRVVVFHMTKGQLALTAYCC